MNPCTWIRTYLSDFRSCSRLQRHLRSDAAAFDAAGVPLGPILTSPCWQARNIAVKLVARFHREEFYPVLAKKLTDPREAPIVRRNCVECLVALRMPGSPYRAALKSALRDTYWEVRTEALKAFLVLETPSAEITGELLAAFFVSGTNAARHGTAGNPHRLREQNFEVLTALAAAFGRLGEGPDALAALGVLAGDPNWIVRAQACIALADLGVRSPEHRQAAEDIVRQVERLSDGAMSHFPLLERIRTAASLLAAASPSPHSFDPVAHYINMKDGWFAAGRAT